MSTEMKKRKSLRRWVIAYATAVVLGLLVSVPSAAMANIADISGQQGTGGKLAYQTPRVNGFARNFVAFLMVSDGGVGGNVTLGLRNGAGVEFSSKTGVYNSWQQFSDGANPYVRAGTFYLNATLNGQCGGEGCGLRTWTGQLQWNINYN